MEFDFEKDVWDRPLYITGDDCETRDGKSVLKCRYPKIVSAKIRVIGAKIDSFAGFPEKFVGVRQAQIEFENCQFSDFADFPELDVQNGCALDFVNCRAVEYGFFQKLGKCA